MTNKDAIKYLKGKLVECDQEVEYYKRQLSSAQEAIDLKSLERGAYQLMLDSHFSEGK